MRLDLYHAQNYSEPRHSATADETIGKFGTSAV
jgi:hypothetical protein